MAESKPQESLDTLTARADSAVRDRQARMEQALGARSGLPRPMARGVLAVGLIAAAVYLAIESWALFGTPTPAQTAADLELAVDLARASIEEIRARTGAFPESLPNASLASVVAYELQQQGYRLSASIAGIRVTIEWDGSRKTEMGDGK